MKHISKALIVFCVSIIVLGCNQQSIVERNVIINEVGFRIPQAYFHELAKPKYDIEAYNLLLSAEMPEIMPIIQKREHKIAMALNGSIMISSPYVQKDHKRKTIPEMMKSGIKFNKIDTQKDDMYGLQYLTQSKNVGHQEIFFEGSKDDPLTVLYCGKFDGELYFPSCKMYFEYNGLPIDVRFRRKDWLSQWSVIKENVINRLDAFHHAYVLYSAQ